VLLVVCLLLAIIYVSLAAEISLEGYHYKPQINDRHGKRIIGGTEANWQKYPWLATNVCLYDGSTEWQICGCSSTMITPFWAVTAGHCVNPNGGYPYKIGLMFSDGDVIEIGKMVRNSKFQRNFTLESHTLYGTVSQSIWDIGLQKLKHPISLCRGKQILDILSYSRRILEQPIVGKTGTLLGWGATTQNQALEPAPDFSSQTLNEIQETVFTNQVCQSELDTVSEGNGVGPSPFRLNSSLFCAHPPGISFQPDNPLAARAGLCQGDSGGPLFIRNGLLRSNIQVLGFVTDALTVYAAGAVCGNGADIFTRLTPEYLDWMRVAILIN